MSLSYVSLCNSLVYAIYTRRNKIQKSESLLLILLSKHWFSAFLRWKCGYMDFAVGIHVWDSMESVCCFQWFQDLILAKEELEAQVQARESFHQRAHKILSVFRLSSPVLLDSDILKSRLRIKQGALIQNIMTVYFFFMIWHHNRL